MTRVEPCSFAPYSDANVRDVPLRDALASLPRAEEEDAIDREATT